MNDLPPIADGPPEPVQRGFAGLGRSNRSHHKKPTGSAPSKPKAKPAPKTAGDAAPDGFAPSQRGSLRKQIGILVGGLNDVLQAVPFTREDALSQDEGDKLVDALDQAQQSNARIKRFLVRSTEGAGVLPLVFVGLSIVLSRLIRHGMLPVPDPGPVSELTPEQQEQLRAMMMARQAQGAGGAGMNGAAPKPDIPLGVG